MTLRKVKVTSWNALVNHANIQFSSIRTLVEAKVQFDFTNMRCG